MVLKTDFKSIKSVNTMNEQHIEATGSQVPTHAPANGVFLCKPQTQHTARRPRPPKLYRIGEVVEYSGMSRQTVHNYSTMGLLPENRWTRGGHRLYDESVFERLDTIAELKLQGKSLEQIRRKFVD